jgi:hypothetical protein
MKRALLLTLAVLALIGCSVRYGNVENWQPYSANPMERQQAFDQCKDKAYRDVPNSEFGQGDKNALQLRDVMRKCMIVNGYKYEP